MNKSLESLTLNDIANNPDCLTTLNQKELRFLWKQFFPRRTIPPTPALRLHELAFAAQAKFQGDLNSETRLLIRQAVRSVTNSKDQSSDKTSQVKLPITSKLKNGTRLIRHWKGTDYEVIYNDKKFYYHDKPYRSLTQIAEIITGTHWSGPRFFGLNKLQSIN